MILCVCVCIGMPMRNKALRYLIAEGHGKNSLITSALCQVAIGNAMT